MVDMNAGFVIAGVEKSVSKLALGTALYRMEGKEKHFDILDDFVSAGGTVIDTGRGYGVSEEVLGLWMESRSVRERIVLITKCGLTNDGILPAEDFPGIVNRELAVSLRVLKTGYIDVYMVHRDNQTMTVGEILDPLNETISKGYVRALGASNWEYRRVTEANEYAGRHGMKGFDTVSNNLSLAPPAAAFYPGVISTDKTGERWHKETGIPLISWSAQARGFFTGHYKPDNIGKGIPGYSQAESDELIRKMCRIYGTEENLERLARAKAMGEKKGGYTAVEVALAWLLHKPFHVVPVVGPNDSEQLASCIKAVSLELTEEEINRLNLDIPE